MKRKKIIKRILATSIVASLSMTSIITAWAGTPINLTNSSANVTNDTFEQGDLVNGTLTENVDIACSVASSFEVTIPKVITMSGTDKNVNYSVTAVGDISGDQVVKVIPDASFDLSEAGGKVDITAIITQTVTEWTFNELLTPGTTNPGSIVADDLTSGQWSGLFWFNISFDNIDYSTPLSAFTYTTDEENHTITITGLTDTEITSIDKNIEVALLNEINNINDEVIPMITGQDLTEINIGNTYKIDGIDYTVTSIGNGVFYNCNGLTNIYYIGTEEEWNAITKGSNNTPLTTATIHYNHIAE